MKKGFKKALAFMLSFALLVTLCAVPITASADGANLKFDSNGKFKIVIFSDVQDQFPVHQRVLRIMEQALARENPDLVVFLGDITELNIKDPEDDYRRTVEQTLAPVANAGIPYAVVFGNHDDQSYYSGQRTDKAAMLSVIRSIGDCRTVDADPSLTGTGTCKIPIYSSNGNSVAFDLFMVDSNTYQTPTDGSSGYDNPHADQLNWLAANKDSGVNSLVFQHIPMPEIYNLLTVDAGGGKTYGSTTYAKTLNANASGYLGEYPCPPHYGDNTGEFAVLKSMGGVLGVVTGHDHLNDFTGTYDGIKMTAVPGMTYYNYGDESVRGYGVIELDESDLSDYDNHTVKFSTLDDEANVSTYTTFDSYDVVTYADLRKNGNPLSGDTYTFNGRHDFTYNATSPSYSAIFKFRWIAGTDTGIQFSFDFGNGSNISYPFGVWVKKPNSNSAGENGAWHLKPSAPKLMTDMESAVTEGDTYDIEIGRLKVLTGAPQHLGEYYIYLKVNGELISWTYTNTSEDGQYMSGGALCQVSNNIRFADWSSYGNKISAYAEEAYEEYDEVSYYDLLDTGNHALSANGTTLSVKNNVFHYDATSATHSAVYKFRWVAGNNNRFQVHPGGYGGSNNFAYRIYDTSFIQRNPEKTLAIDYAINEGDELDIEVARIMTTAGVNAGKYYTYFKVNGVTVFAKYVSASESNTTTYLGDTLQMNLNDDSSYCTIKPIPEPNVGIYAAYDVITYSDLLDTGNNHLSAGGKTLTAQNNLFHYNATSSTHSVIYKFRYIAGAVVYFQMFPGAYRSGDPFAYRLKDDAKTWEKRYAPGNTTKTLGHTVTEGETIDFEIARLKVVEGENAGKYYTYLKANDNLIFEEYVTSDKISGTDLDDSIQLNLNGSNSCVITATPAELEPSDAQYYKYDEIDYEDLLYNGSALSSETTLGNRLLTYYRTSPTYSAILKFRWQAVAGSKFQISFDKLGSNNAINYMFGAQLYTAGSEGKTNDSLRLRPGLDDANAWNELSENIVDGTYYDVEFARLKVKNGVNAGKYYMYFKLDDVMISESYVAANVVDSSGNYTSNPNTTACHLSNEIYFTFWGASGNTLSAIPVPETYEPYDEVTYYDLLQSGNPVTATQTAISGDPKFGYTRTSPTYSVVFKYRWIAGADPHYVFYFDKWSGNAYPFCLAVKRPNYGDLGAAAGPNGAWHLDPSVASHIVQMSEPVTAGSHYDIEHARLKVATGPNAGKFYVYVKVNGELIYGYYYDGDNGNGTYGANNQAYDPSYLRFTSASSGNYITATPDPDVYEDADEVWYTDLSYNGNPVSNEGSGNGKAYTYNKTTTYGSAILKLRWKNANPATQFQISFDRKGTENAINYMFGVQLYLATSDANYPNGLVWLRPGYGPKAELPAPIQSGENYDIEFARLKVIGGRNAGKYYIYLKINDVLIAEDYVAANVVDSEGNYTSSPSSTACHISNEMYITFWGGGGATITNPAYTETYYDYDEVGYDDLSVGGSPVPADKRNMSGGTTLTYNRTSDTGSVVFKYRWTVGDVAKFQMSFDEKAGAEHNNMEYMFGAWLSNPGDTYANGDMYLRPGYGSHVALASALTPGGKYDIEYGRLKVANGPNREKYYVYIKINDELIDSAYVAANVVDSAGNYTTNPGSVQCNVKSGEIFMAFWGSNGNAISSSLVDAYDTADELYYSDLLVGGTPVARERSGNGATYTYNKTSSSGSAILKLRWKEIDPEVQFQMSFDKKGSSDAINYMFGVQLYKPDNDHPNGRVWLRPGYGPSVDFENPLVAGQNYDIEFARIKVILGPNKGKYYMYFKLNDTLIAEDYVAADVVDSVGNYNSKPNTNDALTPCQISNEIYITFWGGNGATITYPESYAEYDEIGYGDLLYGGEPIPGRTFAINNNKVVFTYNRTSDTYSSVLKYRWVAGDPAKFSLSFDTNGSGDVSYPFCAVAKYPNQYGYGATAGANGAWQIDPTQDSLLVNMSSPIVAGNAYDIEFGRLKVISGPYTGKYFVYFKVDGILIQSRYYQVNSNGTYNSTSLSNNIVLSIYSSSGNQILAYGAPLSVSHVGRVGDFDNDGSVGTLDFQKFRKLYLGIEDLGEKPEEILDYNNDGSIDVRDFVSMKKQFLLANSYSKSGSLKLGMQEHLLEDSTKTAAYIADASATLGSSAYRLSMPIHNLYYVTAVNGVGVRTDNMASFKAQIAALKAQGINEILYVTDSFILPYGYASSSNHNKTVPNPSNDMANYIAWLNVNALAFKELAEECPEIKYFEPYNEINLSDTRLEKPGCPWDASSSTQVSYRYTTAERAGITADLCWYVTRAVKSVDIANQVTTPSISVSSASIVESGFLNTLYNEIESGNYPRGNALSDKKKDNFFTIINIHIYPDYSTNSSTRTTNVNNAANRIGTYIYDVMQNHTDGASRVWLTETGVSIDPQRNESYGADIITKFLNKINNNLTYIDTVFFYKVADISTSAGASASETYYGLFYSGDNATASKRYGAKQTANAVYSFFHNGSTDYTALTNLRNRWY